MSVLIELQKILVKNEKWAYTVIIVYIFWFWAQGKRKRFILLYILFSPFKMPYKLLKRRAPANLALFWLFFVSTIVLYVHMLPNNGQRYSFFSTCCQRKGMVLLYFSFVSIFAVAILPPRTTYSIGYLFHSCRWSYPYCQIFHICTYPPRVSAGKGRQQQFPLCFLLSTLYIYSVCLLSFFNPAETTFRP